MGLEELTMIKVIECHKNKELTNLVTGILREAGINVTMLNGVTSGLSQILVSYDVKKVCGYYNQFKYNTSSYNELIDPYTALHKLCPGNLSINKEITPVGDFGITTNTQTLCDYTVALLISYGLKAYHPGQLPYRAKENHVIKVYPKEKVFNQLNEYAASEKLSVGTQLGTIIAKLDRIKNA